MRQFQMWSETKLVAGQHFLDFWSYSTWITENLHWHMNRLYLYFIVLHIIQLYSIFSIYFSARRNQLLQRFECVCSPVPGLDIISDLLQTIVEPVATYCHLISAIILFYSWAANGLLHSGTDMDKLSVCDALLPMSVVTPLQRFYFCNFKDYTKHSSYCNIYVMCLVNILL